MIVNRPAVPDVLPQTLVREVPESRMDTFGPVDIFLDTSIRAMDFGALFTQCLL